MRFFLSLILFFNLLSLTSQAEVVEKIVAIVNDEIITLTDLHKYQARIKSGVMMDDLLTQGASSKEYLADQNKLIALLIDERIIDSEVKKQSLSVTIERVEKEIRGITKNNNMSRNQLKQTLQGQGIDFAEYQNMIKTRLERQALIEKNLTSKIQISDEEIQNYSGNKNSPNQLAEYTIAHIMFKHKKGKDAEIKKRAQTVLQKLKGGESFESLANDFSEDPNFTKGGLLGTFRQGEMLKEFEAPLKALKVGEVSPLVKTKIGYHILRLNDKKSIANPVAEGEKEKIRAQLSQKAFQKQFRIWLDQRKQEAFIKINS